MLIMTDTTSVSSSAMSNSLRFKTFFAYDKTDSINSELSAAPMLRIKRQSFLPHLVELSSTWQEWTTYKPGLTVFCYVTKWKLDLTTGNKLSPSNTSPTVKFQTPRKSSDNNFFTSLPIIAFPPPLLEARDSLSRYTSYLGTLILSVTNDRFLVDSSDQEKRVRSGHFVTQSTDSDKWSLLCG